MYVTPIAQLNLSIEPAACCRAQTNQLGVVSQWPIEPIEKHIGKILKVFKSLNGNLTINHHHHDLILNLNLLSISSIIII